MKSNLFKNIFFSLIIGVSLYSCNLNTSSSTDVSDDATITSFYVYGNDTAKTAVFTINNTTDSIYNVDSLPYNSRIDSLFISSTFTSTSGYIINDTLTYNSSSKVVAIDFTKDTVKITNYASNGVNKKTYFVDIRVHKIDPYLYIWTKLTKQIGSQIFENQKAVFFNNSLFFFTNSGVTNYLYTSSNGQNWVSQIITGLPADVEYQNNIDVFNNKIFIAYGNKIFTSTDGINWTTLTVDNKYTYKSIICVFKNKIYAVGKSISSGNYSIIRSSDGSNWEEACALPDNFPVTGFAATTFSPKIGNSKVLVVGGYNINGNVINTRWSSDDGQYWVNMKNAKSPLNPVSNIAIAYYGSRLLMADTYYADSTYHYMRNSLDYGLTWAKADSAQLFPDTLYTARLRSSMVVDPNTQTMYIVGGTDKYSKLLKDVWKVKVNYYKFNPKDWYKY